jgi:hypothetical protein
MKNNCVVTVRSAALAVIMGLAAAPAHAQWVEAPGSGWISFSTSYRNSSEKFGPTGDVGSIIRLDDMMAMMMGEDMPNPRTGSVRTVSSYLTMALGVAPGLELWVQPSYHRLRYEDSSGTINDSGFGDTRVYVRASPTRLFGSSVPFTIRAGLKVPASSLDVGVNDIQVSDAQRDWEIAAEFGHSFWPRSLYFTASAGYRWREAGELGPRMWQAAGGTDFGNETFFNLSLGGGTDRALGFKAQLEGWYGGTPRFGTMMPEEQARELLRFIPSLLVTAGPGQIELGSRLPLSGKNLIAGPEWVVGYFTPFST